MGDATKAAGDQAAGHLLTLIKQLVKEKLYDGVTLLFTSSREAERNRLNLPRIAMDIYRDICLKHISDNAKSDEFPLYNCAESLLKLVAKYGPVEELLLELLELIEECKSDNVFTSALKALQIILLRQGDEKPRALEWSLNSISQRMIDSALPDYLREGYDEKQEALLEEDIQVQSLLMRYITLGLFYDPLIFVICDHRKANKDIFYPVGITRRNVLCCFLIEMLGKPLSLLDLTNDEEKKTNRYSLLSATSLTKGATSCITDPLFFLAYIEPRARFKRRTDEEKGVYEMSSCNIFLIDEKLPLDCLGIYYYMVFVGNVNADRIPLVYHPLYILESCLYLIYNLLQQNEPPLHKKALALLEKLLENLRHHIIPVSSLDVEIYKNVCLSLCHHIAFSPHIQIRQIGIQMLRQYIIHFDDEGKYLIVKNLLISANHSGINGYLITLYKDLVDEALNTETELPPSFCGKDFRYIFLKHICNLPRGVETDILQHADQIIAALNVLRFLAIKDIKNRTGFWNFITHINEIFLTNLRLALDFSVAHFKAEQHDVELQMETPPIHELKLLDIDVKNDKKMKLSVQLDRETKLRLINQNLCTFDLILSLLSRTSECLENSSKCIESKNNLND